MGDDAAAERLLEGFRGLAGSVRPLATQWRSLVAALPVRRSLWKDDAKRLAVLHVYHKYFEFYQHLLNVAEWDPDAEYSEAAKRIRRVSTRLEDGVLGGGDVGQAIQRFLDVVELECNAATPFPPVQHVNRRLALATRVIKDSLGDDHDHGDGVLPWRSYDVLIDTMNRCIRMRNAHARLQGLGSGRRDGIVIQLRRNASFRRSMALLFKVACRECGHKVDGSGGADEDIYAPPFCEACGSANIAQVQLFANDEEVVPQNDHFAPGDRRMAPGGSPKLLTRVVRTLRECFLLSVSQPGS